MEIESASFALNRWNVHIIISDVHRCARAPIQQVKNWMQCTARTTIAAYSNTINAITPNALNASHLVSPSAFLSIACLSDWNTNYNSIRTWVHRYFLVPLGFIDCRRVGRTYLFLDDDKAIAIDLFLQNYRLPTNAMRNLPGNRERKKWSVIQILQKQTKIFPRSSFWRQIYFLFSNSALLNSMNNSSRRRSRKWKYSEELMRSINSCRADRTLDNRHRKQPNAEDFFLNKFLAFSYYYIPQKQFIVRFFR